MSQDGFSLLGRSAGAGERRSCRRLWRKSRRGVMDGAAARPEAGREDFREPYARISGTKRPEGRGRGAVGYKASDVSGYG